MELTPELEIARHFAAFTNEMLAVSVAFVFLISLLMLRHSRRRSRLLGQLSHVAKVYANALEHTQQMASADSKPVPDVEAQVDVQGTATEAREKHEGMRTTKVVRVDSKVSVLQVPDLMDLTSEQKEHLWWQQHNFEEFLAIRVKLGHAYRAAAQALGVPVSQVTIFGSHHNDGYQAMIEKFPQLAAESRRGLGLGRKRQRAMNRDAYVAAVVEEQKRQRQVGCSTWELDADKMAAVASAVSKKDRDFAARMAQAYYEQDRQRDLLEEPAEVETPCSSVAAVVLPEQFGRSLTESMATELACNLADEAITNRFPKGFGLDRNTLHKAGLSITGHPLLHKQFAYGKRYSLPARFSPDSGSESGAESGTDTGTETEDDVKEGREARTDTRTYGSREQYRMWRIRALDEMRQTQTPSPSPR